MNKPPDTIKPLSNVFEIDKPPPRGGGGGGGGVKTGFTVVWIPQHEKDRL